MLLLVDEQSIFAQSRMNAHDRILTLKAHETKLAAIVSSDVVTVLNARCEAQPFA